MQKGFLLFILLILPCSLFAQLQELEAIPIENPDRAVPVFASYPDAAAIVIQSSLNDLSFDSNLGIVADLSDPAAGEYRLMILPMRQTIIVNSNGYKQLRFNVTVSQAREVIFYNIDKTVNDIQVIFRVNDPNAKLFLNDREYSDLSQPIQAPLGSVRLRLESDGRKTIDENIQITQESLLFEYELERVEPVIFTVQSSPTDATVLFDGVEVGATDASGVFQSFRFPGDYDVTVSKSGFLAETRRVSVTENGTNQTSFTLERNAAILRINIIPSKAQILVNRQQFEANSDQDVAPGLYRIEAEMEGFAPFVQDITIEQGETRTIDIDLEAFTGSLQFSVSPFSASARLVNSEGIEVDSWTGLKIINDLPIGLYTIQVSSVGFESIEEQLRIEQDESTEVNLTLKEGSRLLVDIDGNEYATVRIGQQEWMAENLRTTRYNDRSPISNLETNSEWVNTSSGAWAWYDNNPAYDQVYGKLYNWYALSDSRGLCPEGWNLPSDDEWSELEEYLGGREVAGGKLKDIGTRYWNEPNKEATNESGFQALPGGIRIDVGFSSRGDLGYWWGYSLKNDFIPAITVDIGYNSGVLSQRVSSGYYEWHGLSVRCIKE